jgi:hypothetical protein
MDCRESRGCRLSESVPKMAMGTWGEGGKWAAWEEVQALLHASDHVEEKRPNNRTATYVWLQLCRCEKVFPDKQAYG